MRSVARLLFSSLLLLSALAGADSWRFIITGDGRSGGHRPEDHNGINTVIMSELASAIVAEKPKFLLFSGDLIAGPKSDDEMESQLRTWLEVMKPVYDAGIKVYAIRGNHEMHVPHPAEVWQKVFAGPYALPANGPKGEDEMNYTVNYKNVLIIGIDEFQTETAHVNQPWIDEVLKNNRAEHIFAFAHKMAFRSGHHDDGLETDPAARDRFIKSLIAAGERVVFFGHDHLYDRRTITAPGDPPSRSIQQVVMGTAGAPLVKGTDDLGNTSDWKVEKNAHIEGQYGYATVDIDGPTVKITFKTRRAPGVYTAADTFTYTVGAK